MYFPTDLREFQVELAGTLVTSDSPGDEVKRLRERYGFTQAWLAEQLDMRRESLSRVESGHVNLSMTFTQRFVKVMTLARAAREQQARSETRGGRVDEAALSMLANALRLDKDTADAVILESMINYEQKRRLALRGLGGDDTRSRKWEPL